MQKIIKARKTNKTNKAIEIANATGAYLIVRDRQTARVLSKRPTPPKRYPITFAEFLNPGRRVPMVRNVVIDDADDFLRHVFAGLEIEAITMSE